VSILRSHHSKLAERTLAFNLQNLIKRNGILTITDVFNQSADSYDSSRKQIIPCFDLFYQTVVDLMPDKGDDELRVLDLGAGTGLLTEKILGRYPHYKVDLVDIAGNMLDQAKLRLGENENIRYINGDYIGQMLPGEYDVIVSALSLHHCSVAQLNMVFSKIYHALVAGGKFINADQQLGINDAIEQCYQQHWMNAMKHNGCSDAQITSAIERSGFDKTEPLSVQINLLEAKGFSPVTCWFQHFRFVVYSADKPENPLVSRPVV